jgi:hypothetical protein
MTELALTRASDALAAGVDYAGIYNWSTFLSSVGQPIDGDDANRRAVESSPSQPSTSGVHPCCL